MFKAEYRFKKTWRPYQERVLDELGAFLADGHVHIVAAPGSGKTVLGLEIIRHLNLPTLVFAPTKSIREQWKNRLVQDFLPENTEKDWVSNELRNPKHLTISTYQSLSVLFRKEEEVAKLLTNFREQQIQVLVVDEAHHLRANWWKCLEEVKSSLNNPIIIALTATPPIDVSQAEWNRYSSFCGAVDIEVNVPELVQSGTLSPHQDYIYLNQPTDDEFTVLDLFRTQVDKVLLDLQLDTELANYLLDPNNKWMQESDGKAHFRKYQLFYLSLCVYLRNITARLPTRVVEQYGISSEDLPSELPVVMAESLLQGLCFDFKERLSEQALRRFELYRDRLVSVGAIEKKQVLLRGTSQLEKILKSSPAKLHSVAEIIEHELANQGSDMRAVILADYIRKEALSSSNLNDDSFTKIGVAPIFELLRRLRLSGVSLAMLTGTITIIPKSLQEILKGEMSRFKVSEIYFTDLVHDSRYCYLKVKSSEQDRLTLLITELFELGHLNCLIGTAALLGEGWDAPSVNTLVLATYVGSFVMSNQMRGRAIRRDPRKPGKVSNIWHLSTVAPNQGENELAQKDFQKLKKRFENFHGVKSDSSGVSIESGLGRIDLKDFHRTEVYNQKTLTLSERRDETAKLWEEVFSNIPEGRFLRPIKEIIFPRKSATSKFILMVSGNRMTGLRHTVGRLLRERRMKGVAVVLLQHLKMKKHISGSIGEEQIKITTRDGKAVVSLPSASNKEQSIFVECMDQSFNAFYMADYFLCRGDDYLMIPGLVSQYASEMQRSLKSSGFRRYKLFSSASRAGQQELMKIRSTFLLNIDNEMRSATKVRWKT